MKLRAQTQVQFKKQNKTKDTKILSHPRQNGYHQKNNKCWKGWWVGGTLSYCCWEYKLASMEISMEVLQKN
jgi:hypothetical protein